MKNITEQLTSASYDIDKSVILVRAEGGLTVIVGLVFCGCYYILFNIKGEDVMVK